MPEGERALVRSIVLHEVFVDERVRKPLSVSTDHEPLVQQDPTATAHTAEDVIAQSHGSAVDREPTHATYVDVAVENVPCAVRCRSNLCIGP